jgi:nitrate reductase NapE component
MSDIPRFEGKRCTICNAEIGAVDVVVSSGPFWFAHHRCWTRGPLLSTLAVPQGELLYEQGRFATKGSFAVLDGRVRKLKREGTDDAEKDEVRPFKVVGIVLIMLLLAVAFVGGIAGIVAWTSCP